VRGEGEYDGFNAASPKGSQREKDRAMFGQKSRRVNSTCHAKGRKAYPMPEERRGKKKKKGNKKGRKKVAIGKKKVDSNLTSYS